MQMSDTNHFTEEEALQLELLDFRWSVASQSYSRLVGGRWAATFRKTEGGDFTIFLLFNNKLFTGALDCYYLTFRGALNRFKKELATYG